ncbi:MAG: imidazole glycerol phosphate synthase subunit HisF, partial [Planctomycetota bacterium]
TKRIIPCLDVHGGRTTRGKQFGKAERGELTDVGDPVELARRYDAQGADELVFYDITASSEQREIMAEIVAAVVEQIFMPLTVGGGIREVDDATRLIQAGAEKVSVNSAAVSNPKLIEDIARKFGRCATILGLDAKRTDDGDRVFIHGGRTDTGRDVVDWAREAVDRGAGEIVLNVMNADGMKTGYDIEMTRAVSEAVTVPVVASGGAGNAQHMVEVLSEGKADAALAASIFHFGELTVDDVKRDLAAAGVPVRTRGPLARGY